MGRLAWTAANIDKAKALYEEGLRYARGLGDKSMIEILSHNLGVVARAQGETELARSLQLVCLKILRELDDQQGIGFTLSELINLAAAQDDPLMAAQFAGAAQHQWEVIGASFLQETDQKEVDATLEKVRGLLSEDVYSEAVSRGKGLTLVQVQEWLEKMERDDAL